MIKAYKYSKHCRVKKSWHQTIGLQTPLPFLSRPIKLSDVDTHN